MKIRFFENQRQKRNIKRELEKLPSLPATLTAYRAGRTGYIDMRSAVSVLMPVASAIEAYHQKQETLPSLRPDAIEIKNHTFVINPSAEEYKGVIYPGFSAPEVYTGVTCGIETDVYSFAAILYYLITGEAPENAYNRLNGAKQVFSNELFEEIRGAKSIYVPELKIERDPFGLDYEEPDTIPVIDDDMIDGSFSRIIEKGMAIEPEDRYASIAEMMDALAPYNTKASMVYPILVAVDEEDIYRNLIVSKTVASQKKKPAEPEEAKKPPVFSTEAVEQKVKQKKRVFKVEEAPSIDIPPEVTAQSEEAETAESPNIFVQQLKDELAQRAEAKEEQETIAEPSTDIDAAPSKLDDAIQEEIQAVVLEPEPEREIVTPEVNRPVDQETADKPERAKGEQRDAIKALLDEISAKKAENGTRVELSEDWYQQVWPDEPPKVEAAPERMESIAESDEVLDDGRHLKKWIPEILYTKISEDEPEEELTEDIAGADFEAEEPQALFRADEVDDISFEEPLAVEIEENVTEIEQEPAKEVPFETLDRDDLGYQENAKEEEPENDLGEEVADQPVPEAASTLSEPEEKVWPVEIPEDAGISTLFEGALESRLASALSELEEPAAPSVERQPEIIQMAIDQKKPETTTERPIERTSGPKKPINLVRLWEKLEKMREADNLEEDQEK